MVTRGFLIYRILLFFEEYFAQILGVAQDVLIKLLISRCNNVRIVAVVLIMATYDV